jgi:putative FmdB family regulatory protein
MPIYTFYCEKCKKEFDRFISMNHDEQVCEECESKLKKLMCPSLIKYKGPGFYSTEHPKKS